MTQLSVRTCRNSGISSAGYGPAPIGAFDVRTWAEAICKDWYARLATQLDGRRLHRHGHGLGLHEGAQGVVRRRRLGGIRDRGAGCRGRSSPNRTPQTRHGIHDTADRDPLRRRWQRSDRGRREELGHDDGTAGRPHARHPRDGPARRRAHPRRGPIRSHLLAAGAPVLGLGNRHQAGRDHSGLREGQLLLLVHPPRGIRHHHDRRYHSRVTGTTWMDHEYGYFGGSSADARVRWLLQDLQLDNGYSISNAGILTVGYKPEIDVPVDAYATVQDAEGNLYYVASTITPVGELWTSPATGNVYAQQFHVQIPSFQADLTVSVLVQNQEFPIAASPVYEGVAKPTGTMLGFRDGRRLDQQGRTRSTRHGGRGSLSPSPRPHRRVPDALRSRIGVSCHLHLDPREQVASNKGAQSDSAYGSCASGCCSSHRGSSVTADL